MTRQQRIGWLVVLASIGGLALTAHAADTKPRDAAASAVHGERRITLQTAGSDLASALRLVAEQGGLNLVIGSGVEGQVSVYLEDVPVEAALRALVGNNGYAFTVEDGVITVSKPPARPDKVEEVVPPLETKIFTLQWQDADRVREALEFALSKYGRIKVLNENSMAPYGGSRLSDLSGDINNSASARNYGMGGPAQVPGAPNATNSNLTSEAPRNSRKLIVTDITENLSMIASLVADLDRVPPQVLIEARIVEMSTDLQRRLGIDWDVNVMANGPVLNHTLPLDWRAGFAPGDQTRYTPVGRPMNANPLALGTIDFSRFNALLRIHQTDGAIRLLANPRLLVFNNHSASILVGERYPLLQANITDQGTLTESFDTYIPVGIQLEVTPNIMADGRISMLVHPATSALGDEVIGTTGLRVRRILTREIDTRIIMQDGQTVVLGGLISDRKTRSVNKLPGLGDLPVLSALFRQENPASQRVDLLIFITARVEQAAEISERDRQVFDMYRPHFKQVERLQDVPVHFEIPTEYEAPRPMFGDPPEPEEADWADAEAADAAAARFKGSSSAATAGPASGSGKRDASRSAPP